MPPLVVVPRDSVQPGTVMGWIGTPAGDDRYDWRSFAYATIPDFKPTALAPLPDGTFAVLERAFDMVRGVRCRIVLVEPRLLAGGTVRGEELARAIVDFCEDRERCRRYGANARRMLETRFTKARALEAWKAILQRVANASSGA